MQPFVFSEINYEENNEGWVPITAHSTYEKNDILRNPNRVSQGTYFTLSFKYTFKHPGDRVYFALGKPYSVLMLRRFLIQIKESLISIAKNVNLLEEEGLQKRLQEFASNCTNAENPKEDELKARSSNYFSYNHKSRSLSVPIPENSIAASEILKEYTEREKSMQFNWLNTQDVQIETDNFIYRQENLSRTLIGFPVELITITASK